MKLLTFEIETVLGPLRRIGLWVDGARLAGESPGWALDLNAAYAWLLETEEQRPQARRWADFLFPPDMRAFLELGEPAMQEARRVERYFGEQCGGEPGFNPGALRGAGGMRLCFSTDEITLKPPVLNPRMLRDFLTFETHAFNGFSRRNEPVPEPWYQMPVYYKGNPHTLIGQDEPVLWPHYTRRMDYELELACVIGREGRNIPVEEAGRYIAGYTIMNDFSARDIQRKEMLCRLGPAKAKDFATALGPWLVTADDIADPRNLTMTAGVNGEQWSEGNSGTAHWTFEQMIAHASMEETLYPGDILASGTVGFGSGFELDRWLQPGDTVELAITGLGTLRNKVSSPSTVQKAESSSGK